MHEIDRILAACRDVIDRGSRGLLVTVVSTKGSTYRRAGARAVIAEDGTTCGAISGGCLERDLAERKFSEARVIEYDSTRDNDIVFGLGLGCRGVIEVLVEPFDAASPPRLLREFQWNGREPVAWTTTHEGRELLVEVIRPQRTIAIFGGGPDVAPVARIAEGVGWRATVCAPRDLHPDNVSSLDLTQFDAAVVMTHNYLYDRTLLAALLPSPIAYVGLLGPKSRGEELVVELGADARARLQSPIGLDLGGETPEDIALSIVAEVQAVLNQRTARQLKEMGGSIHDAEYVSS